MNTEIPAWQKLKDMHDAEEIECGGQGRGGEKRPRSRGCMYGPSESLVDQVGDGLIDVNHLMARFEKTGKLEELITAGVGSPHGGLYGDFIGAPDFEQALQISIKAKDQFDMLSAKVRNRFDNDPAKFLAFVGDPANGDELITMGLRKPKEPPKEPEVTLKDVRDAITAGQGKKKTAGKGVEDDGA